MAASDPDNPLTRLQAATCIHRIALGLHAGPVWLPAPFQVA